MDLVLKFCPFGLIFFFRLLFPVHKTNSRTIYSPDPEILTISHGLHQYLLLNTWIALMDVTFMLVIKSLTISNVKNDLICSVYSSVMIIDLVFTVM